MGCLDDKPFGSAPGCSGDEVFSPVTPPPSWYVPPPDGAVDPAENFPNPGGPVQLPPDQVAAMDDIIGQWLNRQALAFKQMGEEAIVYRQKRFGEPCACVDPDTNQATEGCTICFGTRYVGGYDLVGKTVVIVGTSPLARKLSELGLTVTQKPVLFALPDIPLRDRDFVVSVNRIPITDVIRFQQEGVVRAATSPTMDALTKLNVRKIIKVSNTKGGGEDYTQNTDFILTGGELVVENALTAPPNPDTRIIRVLGKRAPLYPPDGETPTGETDPVPTLITEAGLSAGLAVTVFNRVVKPQAFSVTLAAGSGADAGYLIMTLAGATGSGISDQATFPVEGFLTTIVGDTILWLTGGSKPADGATYYVTYECAINVTRRYQVLSVTDTTYQGVAIAVQAEIELMEQTHPIYQIASKYDNEAAIDRQSGTLPALQKTIGQKSGLVTDTPNNQDPRFLDPGRFL